MVAIRQIKAVVIAAACISLAMGKPDKYKKLFKVKPFSFCKYIDDIAPEDPEQPPATPPAGGAAGAGTTEAQGFFAFIEMDLPEEYLDDIEYPSEESIYTTTKKNKDPLTKAMKYLQTAQFFCAKDIRTLCEVGPEEETCPEVVQRECAACFQGAKVLSAECLCKCEDEKPAVAACVSKGPKKGKRDDDEKDDEKDDKARLRRMLRSLKKGDDKDDDKKDDKDDKKDDKDDEDDDLLPGGPKVAKALKAVAQCLNETWTQVSPVCKEALGVVTGSSPKDPIGSIVDVSDSLGSTGETSVGVEGLTGILVGVGATVGAATAFLVYRRKSRGGQRRVKSTKPSSRTPSERQSKTKSSSSIKSKASSIRKSKGESVVPTAMPVVVEAQSESEEEDSSEDDFSSDEDDGKTNATFSDMSDDDDDDEQLSKGRRRPTEDDL